jgi:outer membrane lipoprotein SlyB
MSGPSDVNDQLGKEGTDMTEQETMAAASRRVMFGLALLSTVALAACDEAIVLSAADQDPTDRCVQFRQSIAAARQTEINQQAQGAVAGAFFGAILGAAAGGGDDRQRNMLLGAAAGGLAGFSATYYNQVAQRSRDANALLQNVNADARVERALVTRTGQAAQSLRSCRVQQLQELEAAVRGGRISAADARGRLGAVRNQIATDNRIVSAAFNGIGDRVDAYVDATATAAGVNRAILTNEARAQNAAQARAAQNARAATGNVSAVSRDAQNLQTNDARQRQVIDNRLDALEALLA